ncbi:hypothetical protein MMC19_003692 [Ptychographa xylographoides]|nr:hypothetical protein [Ptychographa xylographoides]
MAGFLSLEAERALLGDEATAVRLFGAANAIPFVYDCSHWAHAHTSPTGLDYFHPESFPDYPTTTAQIDFSAPDCFHFPATTTPRRPPASSSALLLPASASSSSSSSSNPPPPRRTSSSSSSTTSSATHPASLDNYGFLNSDHRSWRCAFAGCTSKAIFLRPCDLRKHFNRHNKDYRCRHDGCPQARAGGFSSKKDRARHEAKHNPGIECEWDGCERIFSRADNMKDHIRRIHRKGGGGGD